MMLLTKGTKNGQNAAKKCEQRVNEPSKKTKMIMTPAQMRKMAQS